MATQKESGDQVEVMFTENVTVDGTPYVANKPYKIARNEAEALFMSGHAVEFTDEVRESVERRKQLPQNRPLKESDAVIATHDSGEQVAYKDPREKGPLDSRPTPTTPLSATEATKLGASKEALRLANERNKGVKGRRVEELPEGDLPTGVPIGNMEAAQSATKALKANTVSTGIEIDTAEVKKAQEVASGEDESAGGSTKRGKK